MDFSSLLSADNPFKFFFLTGAVLILISIYYPFEQSQDIKLKKNNVDLMYDKLLIQAEYLTEQIEILKQKSKSYILTLDSLSEAKTKFPKKQNIISSEINENKLQFNNLFDKIEHMQNELKLKGIDAQYMKSEVDIYEEHLTKFRNYSLITLVLGLFLFIYGGIKWFAEHKNRVKKEFSENNSHIQ